MTERPFDQLAKMEIPPPPADFSGDVHRRINGSLLAAHLADLALRGLPYALMHFAAALAGAAAYSLTGKQSTTPDEESDQ